MSSDAIVDGDAELEASRRPDPRLPLSLRLIVVTAFLPEGLSFFLFGLRLTLTRVIFLFLSPMLVLHWGRLLVSGRYRLVMSDLLIPAAGAWMIIAPSQIIGFDKALVPSGSIALEFCIAYFAARTLLTDGGEALRLADLLCRVIVFVALLGLLDPLTNTYLVRNAVAWLTGYNKVWHEPPPRFGLIRATGPMEHSILFALACGIGLVLAAGAEIRHRRSTIVICTLGLAFSFSAGPLQGVLLGLGLLAYDRMLAGFERRWLVLAAAAGIAAATLFLTSNSPFGFIFDHFTFDPESGYFRLFVWRMAGAQLAQSPWFGIGFYEWSEVAGQLGIPATVDSLWLVSALTFGIPGAALIPLAMLASLSLRVRGAVAALTPADTDLGIILGILIFVIVFVGFTVHLWGTDWIICGLLAGMRAHLGEMAHRRGWSPADRLYDGEPTPSASARMLPAQTSQLAASS